MKKIVEVINLNLFLNGQQILENINLSIEEGDFLAIIGPNGGGKTSLLKCVLGFLKASSGEINLFGKRLSNFKDWHKIGYVPQRSIDYYIKLNPLTVKEFLELPARVYRQKLDYHRLMDLIHLFGLRDLLSYKLSQLSFGQIQRAQIVQALSLSPEILFLDEPTVGLDFMNQKALYDLLNQFTLEGLTVVVVTHETWLLHKGIMKVACLNRRLYFHGKHEDFCALALSSPEMGISSDYHLISHSHW